jgi:hypothetical protein
MAPKAFGAKRGLNPREPTTRRRRARETAPDGAYNNKEIGFSYIPKQHGWCVFRAGRLTILLSSEYETLVWLLEMLLAKWYVFIGRIASLGGSAEIFEMKIIVCFRHLICICRKWRRGIDYSWHVQHLLREFGRGQFADPRSIEVSRPAFPSTWSL